jgi:preprotein translocase subunit SecG
MSILITLFYIVFVLSAIILIVVVLLQEGKGGGFGQALGEHGQQTFGVGAKGINTFTGYTAAVFVLSALLLHILNRRVGSGTVLDTGTVLEQPAEPGEGR